MNDDSNDNIISDVRIMNSEEIKDIKDLILCGICYQVVTEDRIPVECNSCQNQLFCKPCIDSWKLQNDTCPYCHANNAEYVDINPILKDMIRQIKYYCKHQDKGCTEAFTSEHLKRHEAECIHGENDRAQKYKMITKCKACE